MTNGPRHIIECPQCRVAIAPEDFNISTDLAFCRRCNGEFRYSELSASAAVIPQRERDAPRFVAVDPHPDGVDIVYRRSPPILLFLVPFTALWSGGSMYGIYGTQIISGKFDRSQSLFGIPFLIGTIILVSVILVMLLGKWRIRIGRMESFVRFGALGIGWTRRFNAHSITGVSLKRTSLKVNDVAQDGIALRFEDGKELVFGSTMKHEAKQFIAGFIKQGLSDDARL